MKTWIKSAMGLMLLGAVGLAAPLAANTAAGKSKKSKVVYRDVSNKQAYDKASLGQHIAIKITPPKVMGPDQFIFVEVYNNTKTDLSYIEFDLMLANNNGYDLFTKADANDVNKGWSGVKKIAVPGKGPFPPITKVQIDNLRVVNADATPVVVTAYVDLVRNGK